MWIIISKILLSIGYCCCLILSHHIWSVAETNRNVSAFPLLPPPSRPGRFSRSVSFLSPSTTLTSQTTRQTCSSCSSRSSYSSSLSQSSRLWRRTPTLFFSSILTTEEESSSPYDEYSSDSKSPSSFLEQEQEQEYQNVPTLPKRDSDGIYDIQSKEQHLTLLAANPDKIVIVKFFAPWCRACKAVEPKYIQISKDEKYANLPLVFAQLSIQHSKEYVKNLGILALPSVQIYAGSLGLLESFPCGPSKVPMLKKKIAQVVNENVDPTTLQLKVRSLTDHMPTTEGDTEAPTCDLNTQQESEPCTERNVATGISTSENESQLQVGDVIVSEQMMKYLRYDVPFFKDFSHDEFQSVMAKAKYVTFEPGAILMRQGMPGRTFYVIDSGAVEICVKGASSLEQDPLMTPSGYLGTVINRLTKQNYFGERSLITGQPRAASIRAMEKTRCFAFDVEDLPESTVLSGKKRASVERLAQVNDKYGLDLFDLDVDVMNTQYRAANVATLVRGSVNNPRVIRGVDTDEDVSVLFNNRHNFTQSTDDASSSPTSSADSSQFAEGTSSTVNNSMGRRTKKTANDTSLTLGLSGNDDMILSLLIRFKLLRHAARCFEYILQTSPTWGDAGETYRRSLLVSKLTPSQRDEFTDVFRMIDKSGDGKISVLELKNALNSIDDEHSEEEVKEMINKADPSVEGNTEISYNEFMGVMAESEFYYLFSETFKSLDKNNTGFVQAGKLDRVLHGLRDLISDDRMSIIDVDDKDMLIDYETFSRMMIGTH